jgi:aminopeptidase N
MKRNLLIVMVLFLGCSLLRAQGGGGEGQLAKQQLIQNEMQGYKSKLLRSQAGIMADTRYDVTYYKLELRVTTAPTKYLYGKITMTAKSLVDNLDSISLDFRNNMIIDSLRVGGTNTTYTQSDLSFGFHLNKTYSQGEMFTTQTYYEGYPNGTGFGSFVFSSHSGSPWVWSLSEPYGAKDWWPCKDHPSDKADSADIIVTVDSTLSVGSNGLLVSVTHQDSTVTYSWHESYPIASYLISVAIANYKQFTSWYRYTPTDSMPVLNYVLPEHYNSATANLPRIVDAIGIFSDLYGLYPFIREKYGHAEFGWGGAMEHQTMTSTTTFDEGVIVHELAHQWFGDRITCRTWSDIWLNEGFATYNEAIYRDRKYGGASYSGKMTSIMYSALNAIGPIHVIDTSNVGYLFSSALVYNKGAAFLHMLRHIVGDSAFFKGMYNYANDSSLVYNTASTDDFKRNMESVSGKDLTYLFEEWVYGEDYPMYSFTWSVQPESTAYIVHLNIVQKTGTTNPVVYTMPLDMTFAAAGFDTVVILRNDSTINHYSISLPFAPTAVKLDSANWVLKQLFKPLISMKSSVDFGTVTINTSKTDSVTIVNTAPVPMHISGITSLDGSFDVNPTAATIEPFDSLRLYVTFNPGSADFRNSKINVIHDLSNTPDQISVSGEGVLTSVKTTKGLPAEYQLYQNYPDPFNPTTTITYALPKQGHVELKIFNTLGKEIQTLVNSDQPAGVYGVQWNAQSLSSGIYICRLTAGAFSQSRKLVLVK